MKTNRAPLKAQNPLTISIHQLKTTSKVGIWEHEKNAQPILVSIQIEGVASVFPGDITECIDYEPICNWLTKDFPNLPHTGLLETRLFQILKYIFNCDSRIDSAHVDLSKTSAFSNLQSVGVSTNLDRTSFEALCLSQPQLHSSTSQLVSFIE
jgi:dihydroneopterin aldolase